MKQIKKVKKGDLVQRMNLNYNNVYSALRQLLGPDSDLFCDISIMSQSITWMTSVDRDLTPLNSFQADEQKNIAKYLSNVLSLIKVKLNASNELSKYTEDLIEVPDSSFVFCHKTPHGYKFVLAGWGWKTAHQTTTDGIGLMKRISLMQFDDENADDNSNGNNNTNTQNTDGSKSTEQNPINTQANDIINTEDDKNKDITTEKSNNQAEENSNTESDNQTTTPDKEMSAVIVRLTNQRKETIGSEKLNIRTDNESTNASTNSSGTANLGMMPVGSQFYVSLPDRPEVPERGFEVTKDLGVYEMCIMILSNYSPTLFVEDDNGQAVSNHEIKLTLEDKDTIYNSGVNGTIQLPMMKEGQHFTITDCSNLANIREYTVSADNSTEPLHFTINTPKTSSVGITLLDRNNRPISSATIALTIEGKPCSKMTGSNGRAEFPAKLFTAGIIPVNLAANGYSPIKTSLKFKPGTTEYSFRIGKGGGIPWLKWAWIPILAALFGIGGYLFYQNMSIPTREDVEKGIVLVKTEGFYSLSTGLTLERDGFPPELYFTYNEESTNPISLYFDISLIEPMLWTGTGFFISNDGMIATNRHVADPIPPTEEITSALKNEFSRLETLYRDSASIAQANINKYSHNLPPNIKDQILQYWDEVRDRCEKRANLFRSILDNFSPKVKPHFQSYVAFHNSMLTTLDDQAFHPCRNLASGEPGTIDKNDISIIQLNEKEKIMPKDAFIFKIPSKDPYINNKVPKDKAKIQVIGYSLGFLDANFEQGIRPGLFEGNIIKADRPYLVEFGAHNLQGSSGGPLLDMKWNLVGINNSGYRGTNNHFAIRTPYLRDLLEEVKKNTNQE